MKTLRMIGLAMALFGALTLQSCMKDPCKNVTCQNGGTCQDGNCECTLPWEGPKCEVDARDKFVGFWRGTTVCEGDSEITTIGIAKSSVRPNRIVIGSIDADLTSSSTFDIPFQPVGVNGLPETIYGNGSLNGNQLTLNYVLTIRGVPRRCTGTFNKL